MKKLFYLFGTFYLCLTGSLLAQPGITIGVDQYTVGMDQRHIKYRLFSTNDYTVPPNDFWSAWQFLIRYPKSIFGGCTSGTNPILPLTKMDPWTTGTWERDVTPLEPVPADGYCYVNLKQNGVWNAPITVGMQQDLFYFKFTDNPLITHSDFEPVIVSPGPTVGEGTGMLGFSGGGTNQFVGYEYVALPITLSEFKAAWNNSGWVDLKWTTVSEIGSDKFLVERSKDGRKWETIGTESARGAQDIKMDYFLKDYNPHSGINYYRLKMFDLDGSYKYSPIAAVMVEKEGLQAKLYPNPATDFAIIDLEAGLHLEEITLYNIQGKLIKHQTFTEASQYRIELTEIPHGEYFMEIALSDKQIFTKKLILTGNGN